MNDVTKNNFHFVLITEEEYFDYSTYEYYQLSLQKNAQDQKDALQHSNTLILLVRKFF